MVLLPGHEDQDVWRYFASVAFPSEAMVRNVIDALESERPQSTPALEPLVDLGRTRLEMVLKVLDVDGAVRRVKGGWIGTGEPWEYDEARYRKLDEARKREQQAMLDYQVDRRAAGWRSCGASSTIPNSREGERCGRCDNCTGEHVRRHGRRVRGGGHPPAADAARRGDSRPASSGRPAWPSSGST